MELIFHSHANKTHFDKKECPLGLILKVRVFGTRKLPIVNSNAMYIGQQPSKRNKELYTTILSIGILLVYFTYF